MCRWLAYSGSHVRLEELLYGTDKSPVAQSLHSRLGAVVTHGNVVLVGSADERGKTAVVQDVEPAGSTASSTRSRERWRQPTANGSGRSGTRASTSRGRSSSAPPSRHYEPRIPRKRSSGS